MCTFIKNGCISDSFLSDRKVFISQEQFNQFKGRLEGQCRMEHRSPYSAYQVTDRALTFLVTVILEK